MTLLDVNVLLALVDPLHAHHERTKHFFVNRHPAAWATCPIVENGFLRVLSGTGYANRVDSPKTARILLDQMIASSSGHQFWPDDVSLSDRRLFPALPASRHLTDLYLLGLAVKHGGRFATFDQNIDASLIPGLHTGEITALQWGGVLRDTFQATEMLRLRAEAAGVAPRLIANAEDIEKLAANEDEDVAALHGWRAEVFGNDAIAMRKGDLAIALENGEAVVVELEGE